MMRFRWAILCTLFCCVTAAAQGQTLLYDGAVDSPPQDQGWLAFQSAFGSAATETASGRTRLDTDGALVNAEMAGYATYEFDPINNTSSIVNPAMPSLDCVAGYTVDLNMRVLSEAHGSTDRSGVSLITISEPSGGQTLGIELAFWADRIWAQNADFTHGEQTLLNFDTTVAREYELFVQGTTYVLSADGSPILTGPLRNYASMPTPYQLPNFIFLGDNTGSARGDFEFSRLAVTVVPEPGLGALAMIGVAGTMLRRRRGQESKDEAEG